LTTFGIIAMTQVERAIAQGDEDIENEGSYRANVQLQIGDYVYLKNLEHNSYCPPREYSERHWC
jgi:hypothetical protein